MTAPVPPAPLTRYRMKMDIQRSAGYFPTTVEHEVYLAADVDPEFQRLRAEVTRLEAERDALQKDSDILRKCNIVEIAVANDTGSVGEYMKHWESRTLKAEAETVALRAAVEQVTKHRDDLSAAFLRSQERRKEDAETRITMITALATMVTEWRTEKAENEIEATDMALERASKLDDCICDVAALLAADQGAT